MAKVRLNMWVSKELNTLLETLAEEEGGYKDRISPPLTVGDESLQTTD